MAIFITQRFELPPSCVIIDHISLKSLSITFVNFQIFLKENNESKWNSTEVHLIDYLQFCN